MAGRACRRARARSVLMGTPIAAATPDPADGEGETGVPFGLPVLAEVPELAGLLELAVEADRLLARLVEAVIVAQSCQLAEATTGVPLEQ